MRPHAELVAESVLGSLLDRGFENDWDRIDEETKVEIRAALADKVAPLVPTYDEWETILGLTDGAPGIPEVDAVIALAKRNLELGRMS